MLAKQKVTDVDKKAILDLAFSGKTVDQISKKLLIDGRIVSGIVSAARRMRKIQLQRTPQAPLPFPTKEDQMKVLAKSWKESDPDAEFSMHTEKGQKVYIACYKGGVVLRVGEQKKVALLTSGMASRLGLKLGEMAQWSMQPR